MIHREQDGTKLISRRALLLGGGQALLLATLVGRMYYLQVMEASKYAVLADQNRINLRLLPPPRGRILDRNGIPMAVNQQNYRVLVVAEQTDDIGDTLDALSGIVPIADHDRARIIREAERRPSFASVLVHENLSWEEMSRVELNTPDLPGVMIDVGQTRNYPLNELGAHILGYVSAVSESDLQQGSNDPLLELPGFRIGKAGVEKVYDLALRGKGGTSQVEVNAVGRVIRELSRDEGQPGADLKLAIDLDLQRYAMQRLGDNSAGLAMMDVHTGEVLVLAATPSYDPNAFNRGLTNEEWKDLTTNPRQPLINKVIAGQYAPGSTFKMMTALAALESGVTPDTKVFCPGHYNLGNNTWMCWKHTGHGAIDMPNAIKMSCDVYFYEMAHRIQFERIAEIAKRFGLGTATGLDLPGERPGLIPNRAWKRASLGQPWVPGDNLNNAIGQGFVLATPLQLALMAARIANGGYAVSPHLSQQQISGNKLSPRKATDWPDIGISPQSLAVIHRGMEMVANEPHGTAYEARIKDPAMAMAAKTGSAQVRHVSAREHEMKIKDDQIPWKERDNALFIAYAPISAPRFAIGICVEHGMHGGSAAGPVGRDLLIAAQQRAIDPKAPIAGLAPMQPVDSVAPSEPNNDSEPDIIPDGGA